MLQMLKAMKKFIGQMLFNLETRRKIEQLRMSNVDINLDLDVLRKFIKEHKALIKENAKQIAIRDSNIQLMHQKITDIQDQLHCKSVAVKIKDKKAK